jgi:hypothetical protein
VPWAKLFKKAIITNNFIRFDEGLRFGEDTLFVVSYLLQISSINPCNSICYNYYSIADEYISKYKSHNDKILEYSDKIIEHYKKLDDFYKLEGTRIVYGFIFDILKVNVDSGVCDIESFRKGADALLALPLNARILIAEACSHIPQNEDIGRVKLPRLLRKHFGEEIVVDVVSGNDFPADLSPYNIVIHCGACMFTRRHVMSRLRQAKAQNVPITNYGVAIAALTGILPKGVY